MEQITDRKEIQNCLKPEINKIVKFFEETRNAEEAMEQLAELYPKLDTKQLEEQLTKVIFISELLGRLSNNKK